MTSFNMADHVGDNPRDVMNNRMQLQQELQLPAEPLWLHQVHGDQVVDATHSAPWPDADAAYTSEVGVVCAVMTADCVPILLCGPQGQQVAAIHAGWQGLLAGVISNTCKTLDKVDEDWLAWLGPGISQRAFVVKQDVYERFAHAAEDYSQACQSLAPGLWQIDLYAVARQQLERAGISKIYGGDFCSYHDHKRFFFLSASAIYGSHG